MCKASRWKPGKGGVSVLAVVVATFVVLPGQFCVASVACKVVWLPNLVLWRHFQYRI